MMPLIRPAEFARQAGVSRSAVHKALRGGRLSLVDGKIDPAAPDSLAYLSRGHGTATVTADPETERLKCLRLEQQIQHLEISNTEKKRQLVPLDLVRGVVAALDAWDRDELPALAEELAAEAFNPAEPPAAQVQRYRDVTSKFLRARKARIGVLLGMETDEE